MTDDPIQALMDTALRRFDTRTRPEGFEPMARAVIDDLWATGALPMKLPGRKTKWIVGFRLRKSYRSLTMGLVVMGPGRPSRQRPEWSRIDKVEDNWIGLG
jgi:hypothetical protein